MTFIDAVMVASALGVLFGVVRLYSCRHEGYGDKRRNEILKLQQQIILQQQVMEKEKYIRQHPDDPKKENIEVEITIMLDAIKQLEGGISRLNSFPLS